LIFLVTAYKYPAQCGRLLRRLRSSFPDARLAVHVDAKSEIRPFVEEADGTGAVFVAERHRVNWGGFSLVEAMLTLAREAMLGDFDRAFFLTEQDYPLTTPAALRARLSSHPEHQFIDTVNIGTEWPLAARRSAGYGFPDRRPRRVWSPAAKVATRLLPPRSAPMELWGGSGWCSLTRPCLEHVVRTGSELARFLRPTSVPDEVFFQTLIMHSEYREQIAPSLTYTKFTGLAHPLIWRAPNLGELLGSRCFFARKFDEQVDRQILDLLDVQIDLA
jgi:hypothetical protein